MSLMLHCGAHKATMHEVSSVQISDKVSDTYVPIPHHQLIHTTLDILDDLGYETIESSHALMKKGQRYFGFFKLKETALDTPKDYDYVLGLRNGHDGQMPASGVFGHSVFVCDNLCFSGDMMKFSRKHTRNIMRDISGVICNKMAQLKDFITNTDHRIQHYKENHVIDSVQLNDILITAMRHKAVNPTALPYVLNEWEKAQSGEGPGGHESLAGHSYWTLLNCFTEVDKRSPSPVQQPLRTRRLTNLLDACTQFKSANEFIED